VLPLDVRVQARLPLRSVATVGALERRLLAALVPPMPAQARPVLVDPAAGRALVATWGKIREVVSTREGRRQGGRIHQEDLPRRVILALVFISITKNHVQLGKGNA
jgi:hypothetical protein